MFDHMVSRHHGREVRISGFRDFIHRIVNDRDIRNSARTPKRIGVRRFNGFIEDREGTLFNAVGHEEPGFTVGVRAECGGSV